jgi:hypothetical protein
MGFCGLCSDLDQIHHQFKHYFRLDLALDRFRLALVIFSRAQIVDQNS